MRNNLVANGYYCINNINPPILLESLDQPRQMKNTSSLHRPYKQKHIKITVRITSLENGPNKLAHAHENKTRRPYKIQTLPLSKTRNVNHHHPGWSKILSIFQVPTSAEYFHFQKKNVRLILPPSGKKKEENAIRLWSSSFDGQQIFVLQPKPFNLRSYLTVSWNVPQNLTVN